MRRNLYPFNPVNTLFVSPAGADYKTINDALAVADSGDTIIIYPGTYDEKIILKDGVDIHCIGGVVLTSSDSGGTIIDNNIAVNCKLNGYPKITNTNGYHKEIELSNASSKLEGVYDKEYEFIASFQVNPAVTNYNVIKNTFPFAFTLTKNGTGIYKLYLNNPSDDYYWEEQDIFAYANIYLRGAGDTNLKHTSVTSSDYELNIQTFDSTWNFADYDVGTFGSYSTIYIHFKLPKSKFKQ